MIITHTEHTTRGYLSTQQRLIKGYKAYLSFLMLAARLTATEPKRNLLQVAVHSIINLALIHNQISLIIGLYTHKHKNGRMHKQAFCLGKTAFYIQKLRRWHKRSLTRRVLSDTLFISCPYFSVTRSCTDCGIAITY